jgi:hypothetical protein
MKYSLRSLMIVVTLFCVVVGGRIEYLRRWADFHNREARNYQYKAESTVPIMAFLVPNTQNTRMEQYHQRLANEYVAAMWRPWTIIDEKPTNIERGSDRERAYYGNLP